MEIIKNKKILVIGGAGFIGSHLCDFYKDDKDAQEYIKYWYKPYPQLLLLHEGLKLIEQKWEDKDIDIQYEKSVESKGTVINLKEYKKKPPKNDNGGDIA